MQDGSSKLDNFVKQGVQGYEGIRNKIDDVEHRAKSKVGEVMSKVGGVQQKLQGQGFTKFDPSRFVIAQNTLYNIFSDIIV